MSTGLTLGYLVNSHPCDDDDGKGGQCSTIHSENVKSKEKHFTQIESTRNQEQIYLFQIK